MEWMDPRGGVVEWWGGVNGNGEILGVCIGERGRWRWEIMTIT